MRRSAPLLVLALPVLFGGVASAKLPPFGFRATPAHPRVGEDITLTMQCVEDVAHIQPWSSCFGLGAGQMAWVSEPDPARGR